MERNNPAASGEINKIVYAVFVLIVVLLTSIGHCCWCTIWSHFDKGCY